MEPNAVTTIRKSFAEFEKRILQSGWKMKNTKPNGQLFRVWFDRNNLPMEEATPDQFLQAFRELKSVIDWGRRPKPKGDAQDSNSASRRNYAKPDDDDFGKGEAIMRDAVTQVDRGKAATELRAVRSTISGHCGRTHAATYRERAELEKTLNDLLKQFPEPKLTLKAAEFIKSQIAFVRNGFPE
jgi:hypothetical protein